jgi:hypothetical protein
MRYGKEGVNSHRQLLVVIGERTTGEMDVLQGVSETEVGQRQFQLMRFIAPKR